MKVIVLPGFGGSKLDRIDNAFRRRVWFDTAYINSPQRVQDLQLDASGLLPGPDAEPGISIVPGGFWPGPYDDLLRTLNQKYTAIPIDYDWRKSVGALAVELMPRIDTFVGDETFAIVAHSYGGLVARGLYKAYADAGRTAQIKRIVTLATPHWGTYGTVQFLARIDELYQTILAGVADRVANALQYLPLPLGLRPALSIATLNWFSNQFAFAIDSTVSTWPSILTMMPSVHEPGFAAYDPDRAAVYQAVNWDTLFVSNPFVDAGLLVKAQTLQTLLAANIPPPSVMVNLLCRTAPQSTEKTYVKLDVTNQFDDFNSYGTGIGDNLVYFGSQYIAGPSYSYFGRHQDFANHAGMLKDLPFIIDDGNLDAPPNSTIPFEFGPPASSPDGEPFFTPVPASSPTYFLPSGRRDRTFDS